MYLDEIKKKLEELGYYSELINNKIKAGKNYQFDSDLGFGFYQSGFIINKHKNGFFIEYSIGQLSVKREFSTIEELLDFIKEVFPLEEK